MRSRARSRCLQLRSGSTAGDDVLVLTHEAAALAPFGQQRQAHHSGFERVTSSNGA